PAILWIAGAAPAVLRAQDPDPFAGVVETPQAAPKKSWTQDLGFRKEIMSLFDGSDDGRGGSRQSVGFEILKKFSTETSTVAAFDFQGRLVRRDGTATPGGWTFEYHNLYAE